MGLTENEMEHYRAPFLDPSSREPLYRWANELPIEGKPADVYAIAEKYHAWLFESEAPGLFFSATPGVVIGEELAGWYRNTLKNTRSVDIGPWRHFLQEDNPSLIGGELAKWMDQVILHVGEKPQSLHDNSSYPPFSPLSDPCGRSETETPISRVVLGSKYRDISSSGRDVGGEQ